MSQKKKKKTTSNRAHEAWMRPLKHFRFAFPSLPGGKIQEWREGKEMGLNSLPQEIHPLVVHGKP